MKQSLIILTYLSLVLSLSKTALADDDFYGVIESRPDGKVGTWVVGGRSIEVTDETDLDVDNGALEVGACVEVEMDDGDVEEIDSKPRDKCGK